MQPYCWELHLMWIDWTLKSKLRDYWVGTWLKGRSTSLASITKLQYQGPRGKRSKREVFNYWKKKSEIVKLDKKVRVNIWFSQRCTLNAKTQILGDEFLTLSVAFFISRSSFGSFSRGQALSSLWWYFLLPSEHTKHIYNSGFGIISGCSYCFSSMCRSSFS
jgi:hypothetical protein